MLSFLKSPLDGGKLQGDYHILNAYGDGNDARPTADAPAAAPIPRTSATLTDPSNLTLWHQFWGDPLTAAAGNSTANASLMDNRAFTLASLNSYPQPDPARQLAQYAQAEDSSAAVVVPTGDSSSVVGDVAHGALALATGKVSLASIKGEVVVVVLGLVLLALGIYAAIR